jgi:hypothetical protein
LNEKEIDQLLGHYRSERRRLAFQLENVRGLIADLKRKKGAGTQGTGQGQRRQGVARQGHRRPDPQGQGHEKSRPSGGPAQEARTQAPGIEHLGTTWC